MRIGKTNQEGTLRKYRQQSRIDSPPNLPRESQVVLGVTVEHKLPLWPYNSPKRASSPFDGRRMLDDVVTNDHAVNGTISYRPIDRTLNHIDVGETLEAFFHHTVYGMGQFQYDDLRRSRFADPFALNPASRAGIHHDLAAKHCGRTKCIFDSVSQPIELEVVKIEILTVS